jgi:hypothetical protein
MGDEDMVSMNSSDSPTFCPRNRKGIPGSQTIPQKGIEDKLHNLHKPYNLHNSQNKDREDGQASEKNENQKNNEELGKTRKTTRNIEPVLKLIERGRVENGCSFWLTSGRKGHVSLHFVDSLRGWCRAGYYHTGSGDTQGKENKTGMVIHSGNRVGDSSSISICKVSPGGSDRSS